MISVFEPFIALRYLRSKRKEVFISIITVISVLGVAVSVLVLDMVLSIMTGFEAELQAKLVDANAHIVIRRFGGNIRNYRELIEEITKVKGVVTAFPYTYNQAMISTEMGARGLLIRGVAEDSFSRDKLAKIVKEGRGVDSLFAPASTIILRPDGIEDQVELPPLIVGRTLRDRLNLMLDTPVTLLAPRFGASPQGLIPKLRRFLPVGFYHSGLVEYETGLAYVSMKDAQSFFVMGDGVTGIEVVVQDLFQSGEIARMITDKLGGTESPYYATDWTEQNKPLWDAIQLEKRVYFIVLLLLILVASFSIVSTLVMVVLEKKKDIAILKSMGATDGSILRVFLLQGLVIGVLGTILGTILGFIGCVGLREYGFEIDERVFSLSTVPVHILPENFLLVAVSALLITAISGIYPAYRGSRIRPADALRFE